MNMKKLLGILGTITIAGSGMLNIVGNAPASAKKEITFAQENNLENLIRVKRAKKNKCNSNINKKLNKGIITPKLIISHSLNNNYNEDMNNIINFLINQNILVTHFASSSSDYRAYSINVSSEYNYFIIPVFIEDLGEIALVFRSSDLYLQGFIRQTTHNLIFQDRGTFYFFKDATIDELSEIIQLNNQTMNITNERLDFSSDYGSIIGSNAEITWTNIASAFESLFNSTNNNVLQSALARVILATSENIRLGRINNLINEIIFDRNKKIYWEKDIKDIVNNWSKSSKETNNLINELQRKEEKKSIPSISKYIAMSKEQIVEKLEEIDVKVLLATVLLSYCNAYNEYNIRKKRDLEQTCHIDNYLMYDFYDHDSNFERTARFITSSNWLKLKFTYVMWEKINILKQIYGSSKFEEKLREIITNFPQNYPDTWWPQNDIDSMTKVIIDNYNNIHNKIQQMKNENTDFIDEKYIVIETCGNYCWEEDMNKNIHWI